ncbi:MAG: FtsX-like permease family protein [Brevinematales bacterium]
MWFYLKLGARNLIKNFRRSFKTVLVVSIGLAACLLTEGFMSHTMWGLRESLINGGLGHFQIYRKGYIENQEEKPYNYLIKKPDKIFEELNKIKGLKFSTPRLSFQGLISSGEKSSIVIGFSGIASQEKELNNFSTLISGNFLDEKKTYGLIVGTGVAKKLNLKLGDTVTLMATLKDGGVNALDFEIIGIIEAQIKAYNEVLAIANLKAIQKLLNLSGSVDRIIILLDKTENIEKIEPLIKDICQKNNLEYLSWKELAEVQYSRPKFFYELVYLLIMSIVVLVVIFSITNTLNLAMQERVREIGTMRAVGTTQFQTIKIFLSESFLIGLAGGFLGILLGYLLSSVFNWLGGVPIPPPPGQARGYIALFKPDFVEAIRLMIIFLFSTVAGGLYPAFRASRLKIVDALRWI